MLELSQSMTILTILISYIVLDPDMESVVNPSGYHNQQSSIISSNIRNWLIGAVGN